MFQGRDSSSCRPVGRGRRQRLAGDPPPCPGRRLVPHTETLTQRKTCLSGLSQPSKFLWPQLCDLNLYLVVPDPSVSQLEFSTWMQELISCLFASRFGCPTLVPRTGGGSRGSGPREAAPRTRWRVRCHFHQMLQPGPRFNR